MKNVICPENLRFTASEARGALNTIAPSRKLWQNMGLMPQRPPLKISARHAGSAVILDLTADITLLNSPVIRKALIDQLQEQRVPHLIINMLAGTSVDTSCAAAL